MHGYGATVATILAERQQRLGITFRPLGERAGVEYSRTNRILRGVKPMTLDEFAAICRALGVEPVAVLREADRRLGIARPPFAPDPERLAREAALDPGYPPEVEYEQPSDDGADS